MSNDCFTCKYDGNNIERDPCRRCDLDKGSGSRWEPRDAAAVTPDRYQQQALAFRKSMGKATMIDAVLLKLEQKSRDISVNIALSEFKGTEYDTTKLADMLIAAQMCLAQCAGILGLSLSELMMRNTEEMQKIEDTLGRGKGGE